MKPVVIFRHAPTEGPGYIAVFLEQHGIPFEIRHVDAGDPIPDSPTPYAGLVFMGGPMSVNDELPWIPPTLALIRAAVAQNIPVLGHCLGGQLIAKALGGRVTGNPVKEIGWGTVHVLDNPTAQHWLGDVDSFTGFHWHGETFSDLPPGAVHILKNDYCEHQAYALGPHLGMQCHVEMTATMIRDWCETGASELAIAATSPAVQSARDMQAEAETKLAPMTAIAERLYSRWIEGLRHNPTDVAAA